MPRPLALIAAVVAGALVPAAHAVSATPHASPAKRSGPTVSVRTTRYGRVLTDGRGRVLYLFTRDGRGRSRCYKACARAWPVFLAKGTPRAGRGVRASLLGTRRRGGGRVQVTYGGRPLYYYVADTAPRQVTCQAVYEFGGTWLVLRASGKAVH